jgi:UDP:flavonoid glycosyltransferase YjiC (YdhE family)
MKGLALVAAVKGTCMSNILVASTPLLGHVTPMLIVAKFLRDQGHVIYFLTSEAFREKVEAVGIFLPLAGKANYDYRKMNTLFTQHEATAAGLDAHIVHLKRIFGDCIPDQHLGLRRAMDGREIDLILTDVLFMGAIPLLLQPRATRPPIIACGVIAPMWQDAGSSPFAGPDLTTEGQKRNREDHRRFDAAVLPGTAYIDEVLQGLGVAIPGGFRMFDSLYRLPDQLLQFCAADFEYPLVENRENLRFIGPILPVRHGGGELSAWLKRLDGSRAVVLVTQGTLANSDFDQLVNPAITGLAREDLLVIATAGGTTTRASIEQQMRSLKHISLMSWFSRRRVSS